TFNAISALVGGTDDDTFTLGAGVSTFNGSIAGGGGSDTLAATDGTNAWNITGANTGILNTTTTFSAISALVGGADDDTFTLGAGVSTFNGSIAGGGGSDTLAATDSANAWNITGANGGTLNTDTTFSAITSLVGGTDDDTFTLGAGVSTFNGSIAGGGGSDTLAATDGTNAWNITGTNTGNLNTTTTFSAIANLACGSDTDTLPRATVPTTWSTAGADAATVAGMDGRAMDALVGGTDDDTFTLDAGVSTFSGSIAGGGG